MVARIPSNEYQQLAADIKCWGQELGFQQTAIGGTGLAEAEQHLHEWLANGSHGEMDYMAAHGDKRSRPEQLIPGTTRVISVRMDYLPTGTKRVQTLRSPQKAYISRYALGRDYHKLIRKRLSRLIERIVTAVGSDTYSFRAFTDSAPVLEKALAENSGLGWIGKNTLLLNRSAGSWFFLGEIYTDLPLPMDQIEAYSHCGSCTACLDVCPTNAFTEPYQLDARRCISYLTIECKSSIPTDLRPLMGNRVFGCDDCQLVCPWNRYENRTNEADFHPRHGLEDAELIRLFSWSREEFLDQTQGSAIRRAGYEHWLRNIAIALGNAPVTDEIINVLKRRLPDASELLEESILWALDQQQQRKSVSGHAKE
jgi:epoxyqueuosine reductase